MLAQLKKIFPTHTLGEIKIATLNYFVNNLLIPKKASNLRVAEIAENFEELHNAKLEIRHKKALASFLSPSNINFTPLGVRFSGLQAKICARIDT